MEDKSIIMVVDDQPDFVEGVKLILEVEGYKVWTASNGQQAFNRLDQALRSTTAEDRRLPDLILADIMMPIMDGYALYEQTQMNPSLKQIPFIFLTAKTGPADLQQGKALGVEDYLTKPCVPDVLLTSVRGQLKPVEQPLAPGQSSPENGSGVAPQVNQGIGTGNLILILLAVIILVITLAITFNTTNFGG